MLVKIMSSEDLPDVCNQKQFELFGDVCTVDFQRDDPQGYPLCYIRQRQQAEYVTRRLYGNVYVMTDDGKTIETFGVSKVPEPTEVQLRAA